MNEIIARKKAGAKLSEKEIQYVIAGVTSGEIPDYQISALLMAICFQGMDIKERSALTRAMAASGREFDFSKIEGTKVDKHSTGGVGDKTSLILAPWLAAAGAKVPMISGRGLGFTGGTLDKLAAIPGYRFDLTEKELHDMLQDVGCFIIGQTADIAPADKKIYALRDVTSTVDEISLITASILSKKLAEGLDRLVMDVKCGSGAFMQNIKEARALAKSIKDTAEAAGVKTECLITAMDFPLGRYTGNAMEVYEALEFVKAGSIYHSAAINLFVKKSPLTEKEAIVSSLVEVTVRLAAAMLGATHKQLMKLWENGQLEKHTHLWIKAQGGDLAAFLRKANQIEKSLNETQSDNLQNYFAPKKGYWSAAHGQKIGNLMVDLGAGRKRAADQIDDAVTLEILSAPHGDVIQGKPMLRIYKPGMTSSERNTIDEVFKTAINLSKARPRRMKNILS